MKKHCPRLGDRRHTGYDSIGRIAFTGETRFARRAHALEEAWECASGRGSADFAVEEKNSRVGKFCRGVLPLSTRQPYSSMPDREAYYFPRRDFSSKAIGRCLTEILARFSRLSHSREVSGAPPGRQRIHLAERWRNTQNDLFPSDRWSVEHPGRLALRQEDLTGTRILPERWRSGDFQDHERALRQGGGRHGVYRWRLADLARRRGSDRTNDFVLRNPSFTSVRARAARLPTAMLATAMQIQTRRGMVPLAVVTLQGGVGRCQTLARFAAHVAAKLMELGCRTKRYSILCLNSLSLGHINSRANDELA